jgi:hypothetical protein
MKSEEGKDREHNYDKADEIDDSVHGADPPVGGGTRI